VVMEWRSGSNGGHGPEDGIGLVMEMRYEGQRYEGASRCYLIVPPACASGGNLTHPLVAWSVEDDHFCQVRRDGVSEVLHVPNH
jgi:hypothetical protein